LVALAAIGALSGVAVGQEDQKNPLNPPQTLPVKPPPVPTGVIPLPKGPPPTGQQAPVPNPVKPLPSADHPLGWSPDLEAVSAGLAKTPISIQQAVGIALYTNRTFATAVASLDQAVGRTGQAKSLLMPTLGLNGDLTYFDQATTFSFAAPGSSAPPTPIVAVPQFNPVYTAAFSLPIDIAGSLRAAASQSQFNEVAARIDVNRVRNQITYDVKMAFYGALRAQAQMDVATDNVNNAMARLSFADKNYAAGTSARFDVLTAQRDVADAQQSLITARAGVSVALSNLKNTIGISIHSNLRITSEGALEVPPDVLPPTPDASVPTLPVEPAVKAPLPSTTIVEETFNFGPEYDALVKDALENRPEILEAKAQIEAAKRGVQYARRSYMPSLVFGLDYVYTPNANPFTRQHVGMATLNVNIPIFDGGLARARVKEAEGQTAATEVSRRQMRDQVELDVQQAYLALVQARQRVAVTNVEVTQAREALRVGRVRYSSGVSQQVGVSPQLELSNSQVSLTQAETNQVNALYDYNVARAQLDRAMGRYAFTGAGPGYKTKPTK